MRRHIGAVVVLASFLGSTWSVRADDAEAQAIVSKAIKAIGGEAKLSKLTVISFRAKGILKVNGEENPFETHSIFQDVNHYRSEFEGKFGDNDVKVTTVINGDKGWRKVNENVMPLDDTMLANTKRTIQIQLLATLLLPLKGKDYKIATTGEEKVGNAVALGVKVTPADGKDFTIFFDKETGLVTKVVAKVPSFTGEETTQESVFSAYKEFDGVKRPTKIESKRDGQPFSEQDLTEFKALDKAEPGTFDEPK